MLSMQSELSSQQIWTGRSPVIFFLRCQQAEVCSFVSLLQRYSILRFAATKKLGTGFARTLCSQALRARHLLHGSSVCAILGQEVSDGFRRESSLCMLAL